MAEASSDKADQPEEAGTRSAEDAAARLNEILSSPIEDPFAPEPKRAPTATAAPASDVTGEPTTAPGRGTSSSAIEPAHHHNVSAPDAGMPAAPAAEQRSEPSPATGDAKPLPADFARWEGAKPVPPESPGAAAEPGAGPSEASPVLPEYPAVPEQPTSPAVPPPAQSDANTATVVAKVRRLMLISTGLTALAIAAVLGIIGYRIFTNAGRQETPNQATLTLPQGAKIVQTAIAADRLVLTLDLGGALEIRTYDLRTLKPLGQLNFSRVP